jgi:hypothetical protein
MKRNTTAPSIRPTAPRPGATVLDFLAAAGISPDGRIIAPATPLKITTEEAAERMRNRPQTWRAAYCRDGHFHGLVPTKLPSSVYSTQSGHSFHGKLDSDSTANWTVGA